GPTSRVISLPRPALPAMADEPAAPWLALRVRARLFLGVRFWVDVRFAIRLLRSWRRWGNVRGWCSSSPIGRSRTVHVASLTQPCNRSILLQPHGVLT